MKNQPVLSTTPARRLCQARPDRNSAFHSARGGLPLAALVLLFLTFVPVETAAQTAGVLTLGAPSPGRINEGTVITPRDSYSGWNPFDTDSSPESGTYSELTLDWAGAGYRQACSVVFRRGGTAREGSDYEIWYRRSDRSIWSKLTGDRFRLFSTSYRIRLVALKDSLGDYGLNGNGETATLALSGTRNCYLAPTLAGGVRTVTIRDAAGTAELRRVSIPVPINDIVEGVSREFSVAIRRGELEAGESVEYELSLGGVATRGTDYTLSCGSAAELTSCNLSGSSPSVTLSGPLERSGLHVLTVNALEDNLTETGGETLSVTLGGGVTWSGKIVDPPSAVTVRLSRDNYDTGEHQGPHLPTILVSPRSGTNRDLVIPLIVTGITATAGEDFTPVTSVTLPKGDGAVSPQIPIINDNVVEGDETFTVAIDTSNLPSGMTAGSITSATVTITDDDTADTTAPRVTSITRQSPSTSPTAADSLTWRVTFNEAVANVDAADFSISGTTASLSVAAVSGTNAYDVTAAGGNLAGLDGTVTLSFASGQNIEDGSGNALANTTPTGMNQNTYVVEMVTDNDSSGGGTDNEDTDGTDNPSPTPTPTPSSPPPAQLRLAPPPAPAAEGAPLVFAVTVASAVDRPLRVPYRTGDGSAVAGEDYEAANDTLVIPAGASRAVITVVTLDDDLAEVDETVTLTLSPPDNAVLSVSTATGTIRDDDPAPPLRVEDAVAREGEALVFRVGMAGTSGRAEQVAWSILPGTATAGEDYEAASGTLTIPAGEEEAVIRVLTLQDALDEPDETLRLRLSPVPGARQVILARDLAEGRITDDDAPPQLSVAADPVTEGAPIVFHLSLSAPSALPVTVTWRVDGTAVPGEDYEAVSGTLVIPPGETTAAITVQTLDDDEVEDEETLRLVLEVAGATLAEAETVVRVLDDDAQVAARLTEVNKAVLPHVTATLAHLQLARLDACLQGAAGDVDMTRAVGNALRRLPQSSSALAGDGRSLWERFGGSAFRHALGAGAGTAGTAGPDGDNRPGSAGLTLCGGLDWQHLADKRRGTNWDGALYGGYLGGRLRLAGDLVAGANLSHSVANVDYAGRTPDGADGDGEWTLSLTGVQPYLSRGEADGRRLWALVGWGTGELILKESARRQAADVTQWQAALGGDLPLRWEAAGAGPWQRRVELKGSAWWSRLDVQGNGLLLSGTSADVHGFRALLDTSARHRLDDGAAITITAGAGLRYDGDAAGAGLEWESGLAYRTAGARLQARLGARGVLLRGHSEDWGLSAALTFDPQPDSPLGLNVSLRREQGRQARLGVSALPQPGRPAQDYPRQDAAAGWQAELAWGLPAFHGRFLGTPRLALNLQDAARELQLGWRLTPLNTPLNLQFDVLLTRATRAGGSDRGNTPDYGLGSELRLDW